MVVVVVVFFFFFNDTATTEIYTLSLHDALPIYSNGHADGIATHSYTESVQFASQVRSASEYVNASPRFQRNSTQVSEIALGMSAQRGLKGGRITLDTLLTHKAVVQGLEY